MKHIEQIQPEVAAYDLERIFREEGDATATAALTRLLHDWTGCDIPQTDTTPQSDVDELVPLAVSILRRHWTTPLTALGDGTTPMSLADLLRQSIGDRVQGNEAMCIPPANESIPHAVSALRERKIGGVPQAPDGVSFARIFCDSTTPPITELIDDNIGWVMNKMLPWSYFPNVTKAVFNTESLTISDYQQPFVTNKANLYELELPHIKKVSVLGNKGSTGWGVISKVPLKSLHLPMLEEYYTDYHSSSYEGMIWDCAELEEFIAPNLTKLNLSNYPNYENAMLVKCLALKKIVLGKIEVIRNGKSQTATGDAITGGGVCLNLVHLEIGQGTNVSLMLSNWNPTTALADNLSLFLSNFRLYIADRLSGDGSGKTLTLSQEVRDAIHSAGIDTIITNKGWTISPVPTQQ